MYGRRTEKVPHEATCLAAFRDCAPRRHTAARTASTRSLPHVARKPRRRRRIATASPGDESSGGELVPDQIDEKRGYRDEEHSAWPILGVLVSLVQCVPVESRLASGTVQIDVHDATPMVGVGGKVTLVLNSYNPARAVRTCPSNRGRLVPAIRPPEARTGRPGLLRVFPV